MNIINLRSVSAMEIPDSFRGILRISPNNGEDNAKNLLTTSGSEIHLSDSEGDILPITFIPKTFETIILEPSPTTKSLIHVTQRIENLFVSETLNICASLYIHLLGTKIPLIFSDGRTSLGYPIEAPENIDYFNHSNKYGFNKNLSLDDNIDNISPEDPVYKDKNQWVKINNDYPYRYIQHAGSVYKLPYLKKREYALGHIKKHHFKHDNSSEVFDLSGVQSTQHTQLSYIPVESLSFSSIESQIGGLYRAPLKGRYFKLNSAAGEQTNTTANALAKILFGNNIAEEDAVLTKKAPIMGIPVQSGTIHYNAIPAKHYFFHLIRHYDAINRSKCLEKASKENIITSAQNGIPNVMNNLIRNYVLCDGKDIKTGYPNISSDEVENKLPTNASTETISLYKAIAKSITKNNAATTFSTPPLFEFDQLSLRFLRGLNWIKDGESYKNNTKTYVKIYDEKSNPKLNDRANHAKDINEVGVYYSNSDNDIQKTYKHAHLLFAVAGDEVNYKVNNKVVTDTLFNEKNMFQGLSNSELPSNKSQWADYVNSSSNYFLGTKMLKTTGSLRLAGSNFSAEKEMQLQNYPISVRGGSNSYFYIQAQCIRFGKRRLGKCMNHRTRCQTDNLKVRDGYYHFASCDNSATGWRFLTSMPRASKYGQIDAIKPIYSTLTDSKDNSFRIDDSLSSPPAINLIPLMKI